MVALWAVFDTFKNYPIVLTVKHQNYMLKYTVDTVPRGVEEQGVTIHKYFSLP